MPFDVVTACVISQRVQNSANVGHLSWYVIVFVITSNQTDCNVYSNLSLLSRVWFHHCEPKYLEICGQQVMDQLCGDQELDRNLLDICIRRLSQIDDMQAGGSPASQRWRHLFESDILVSISGVSLVYLAFTVVACKSVIW